MICLHLHELLFMFFLSSFKILYSRKLKNRVAAQTARDRKKARMDTLEEQMAVLENENMRLQKENELLRLKTGALSKENHQLKSRLGQENHGEPVSILKKEDTNSIVIKGEHGPGSAVLCTPLPKEKVHALFLLTTQFIACLMTLR